MQWTWCLYSYVHNIVRNKAYGYGVRIYYYYCITFMMNLSILVLFLKAQIKIRKESNFSFWRLRRKIHVHTTMHVTELMLSFCTENENHIQMIIINIYIIFYFWHEQNGLWRAICCLLCPTIHNFFLWSSMYIYRLLPRSTCQWMHYGQLKWASFLRNLYLNFIYENVCIKANTNYGKIY